MSVVEHGGEFRNWTQGTRLTRDLVAIELEIASLVSTTRRIERQDGRTTVRLNPNYAPDPQVVGIFGRGIGFSKDQDKFIATPMFESIESGGHPYTIDKGIDPNENDEGIINGSVDPTINQDGLILVAGAKSHIVGTARRLLRMPTKPSLIIYSAGRPKYLDGAPEGISEGGVLQKDLHKIIGQNDWWNGVEEQIHADNLNSRSDAVSVLQSATEGGYKNVDIYTIEPHCPRVAEMFANILQSTDGDKIKGVKNITVKSSWQYLRNQALVRNVKSTRAYATTLQRELNGIKSLQAGRYKSIQDKK